MKVLTLVRSWKNRFLPKVCLSSRFKHEVGFVGPQYGLWEDGAICISDSAVPLSVFGSILSHVWKTENDFLQTVSQTTLVSSSRAVINRITVFLELLSVLCCPQGRCLVGAPLLIYPSLYLTEAAWPRFIVIIRCTWEAMSPGEAQDLIGLEFHGDLSLGLFGPLERGVQGTTWANTCAIL